MVKCLPVHNCWQHTEILTSASGFWALLWGFNIYSGFCSAELLYFNCKKISSLLLTAESTSFTTYLWPYAPCLDVSSFFIPLFSFLKRPPQLLLEDLCMETALRKVPCSFNRSHEILCLFLRIVEKKIPSADIDFSKADYKMKVHPNKSAKARC